MAIRWVVQNGNYSSTSTWNDGATLGIPTVGDDVWANGFTVNMDVNATVNSLNNTARARDIATPQMTSNSTPSGNVVASNANISAAFGAFDRLLAQPNRWSATFVNPSWIQYQFPTAKVIKAYRIFGYPQGGAESPFSWTLQGSNDGSNFTIIDTQTSVSILTGSWTSPELSNNTSYLFYRLNITANSGGVNLSVQEIEYYEPFTGLIAAGGSFNFNTGDVSVTCTSTSASLSAGATNLITVTATGGTVTLNVGSNVTTFGNAFNTISHTGNCNLILYGQTFIPSFPNARCINKTSSSTITIYGNLEGGNVNQGNVGNSIALLSTGGNTVIFGNVTGGNATGSANNFGISQTNGDITITGNVIGGKASTHVSINYVGSGMITITGNVIGDVISTITTTASPIVIIGNVIANVSPAISSTATITITITGNVYASALSSAINLSTGTVNLTGNMYNTLGRMAIWCPNVFISNTATTLWRMDIGGGATRTLYSADSFPNLPSVGNVRSGIEFGPASGLTGTMIVPTPSNVRVGVLTDNTVGTANITAQDILNFINTSSDPLAVRMRTMLTDNSAGQLISKYNFV